MLKFNNFQRIASVFAKGVFSFCFILPLQIISLVKNDLLIERPHWVVKFRFTCPYLFLHMTEYKI